MHAARWRDAAPHTPNLGPRTNQWQSLASNHPIMHHAGVASNNFSQLRTATATRDAMEGEEVEDVYRPRVVSDTPEPRVVTLYDPAAGTVNLNHTELKGPGAPVAAGNSPLCAVAPTLEPAAVVPTTIAVALQGVSQWEVGQGDSGEGEGKARLSVP